jgi:hypothetical protein
MFSVVMPDKTVKDITYKKRAVSTIIYLGDKPIGRIFPMSKNSYSIVVIGETPHPLLRSVDGLKNRYYCTKFALEALGYWKYEDS